MAPLKVLEVNVLWAVCCSTSCREDKARRRKLWRLVYSNNKQSLLRLSWIAFTISHSRTPLKRWSCFWCAPRYDCCIHTGPKQSHLCQEFDWADLNDASVKRPLITMKGSIVQCQLLSFLLALLSDSWSMWHRLFKKLSWFLCGDIARRQRRN